VPSTESEARDLRQWDTGVQHRGHTTFTKGVRLVQLLRRSGAPIRFMCTCKKFCRRVRVSAPALT
jgi:hypothetical protein